MNPAAFPRVLCGDGLYPLPHSNRMQNEKPMALKDGDMVSKRGLKEFQNRILRTIFGEVSQTPNLRV